MPANRRSVVDISGDIHRSDSPCTIRCTLLPPAVYQPAFSAPPEGVNAPTCTIMYPIRVWFKQLYDISCHGEQSPRERSTPIVCFAFNKSLLRLVRGPVHVATTFAILRYMCASLFPSRIPFSVPHPFFRSQRAAVKRWASTPTYTALSVTKIMLSRRAVIAFSRDLRRERHASMHGYSSSRG